MSFGRRDAVQKPGTGGPAGKQEGALDNKAYCVSRGCEQERPIEREGKKDFRLTRKGATVRNGILEMPTVVVFCFLCVFS